MYILGHRGIPTLVKENTLASLLKAIDLGADGIETDVRLTRDGVPVLIHDDNLSTFDGSDLKVHDLALAELKEHSCDGLTIPTLEEFLRAAPDGKCLNIELKEYEAGEIALKMCEELYQGEIIYSSFNHVLISELKQKYPALKFGYLFDDRHLSMSDEELLQLFKTNTYSAHLPIQGYMQYPERLKSILKELKRLDVKIVFWTVNSKDVIRDIFDLIDYVITDDVRLFI
ncbi:MAG: glycerophosphodiester phosphodiesterase family protein [Fervidobacterium sp.]|uniref:glycerophosphodiester phosphodiesterase family protein n=1 Tax=Fervidobacterium sp. TaxID=1871331 RepID=UPI00404B658F